jgi:hypothetical protein
VAATRLPRSSENEQQMDLAECDWYPATPGTTVQMRASDSPAIRIHESQAPIRPAARAWGVMIDRNPHSQSGHDLPDDVVRELASEGLLVDRQRIPAERLNAAAERAVSR